MRERKKMFMRLAKLYGLVEEARSVEMRRAAGLVVEVDQAIATQDTSIWASHAAGRSALFQNDQLGWKQAEAGVLLAGSTRSQLADIREERLESHASASEQYQTSRIQSEQLSRLLEDATMAAETVELRRTQAAADDRHLSRRRWAEMRGTESIDKTAEIIRPV
jgi:hypothetical protein